MNFEKYIHTYSDFPKTGILFHDFTPLLSSPATFRKAIHAIKNYFLDETITHIAAIEAKGFTLGSALAYEMALPLTLVRKAGLIPGNIVNASFMKEYGQGVYQMKRNCLAPRSRVLIVYDILAGPGATEAAINLVEAQSAHVVGCAYAIELQYLAGREALQHYNLFSLVQVSNVGSRP